jgi:hypothetical protein
MARTRSKLTKKALPHFSNSPFAKLYSDGSDQDFMAVLSLTRAAFNELLQIFRTFYVQTYTWRPGSDGRPPVFNGDPAFALGLVLSFYRKSIELNSLCQLFGLPPSSCCRVLHQAEDCLQATLAIHSDARISWPTIEEQYAWELLVNRRNSLIRGRWGFIDGKNYVVQKPGGDDLQNEF